MGPARACIRSLQCVSCLAMKLLLLLAFFSALSVTYCERVMAVSTHTASCLTCGMIEGTGYLTVQICGSTDCCLSRSLDNDNINWIPGQTDTFTGESSLLECAEYEIGSGPFVLTAFHDGVNGLVLDWIDIRTSSQTVRCEIDQEDLDDHSFTKATCS